MPARIPLLSVEESVQRVTALGFDADWGRLTMSRSLLHQPAAAAVLANVATQLLRQPARLEERLLALIIMRTAHVTGMGLEWRRHLRDLLHPGLSEADMNAAIEGPHHAGLSPSGQAVLMAVDDVLATGRIHDETWTVWNQARPSVEASIEMVVAVGVWRMASELILSLDIRPTDHVTPLPPVEEQLPARPQTLFDGSASAIDRLAPVGVVEAESLCRDHEMSPGLAKSAVWTRMLRHPPVGAALSRQLYHLLQNGMLSARLREFVIMRIGWVTGTAYEWTRHWPHAMKAGITSDELVALRNWRSAGFGREERAVLAATDETLCMGRVSDATWVECSAVLEPALRVELLAVIGTWHLFSQLMRSLAIPLESDALYWQPDGQGPFG